MKIKASVVQIGAIPFDPEATTTKIVSWMERAADEGGRLILFPEAVLSAYPKGLDFGCCVGKRTPEGRESFRLYYDSAVIVPGPETARIAKAAAETKTFVVVGVIERDGGTLYCTALFFSSEGELLGKHRKLMPTSSERLVWGFGDGSTLPVYDTPVGRIGAVICWENYMPMLRMTMYSKNVSVYCAPTADDRETWLPSMRHIALEGRCFVLTSCQVLRRKDFPVDYACRIDAEPDDYLMRGGAAIIDPLGKVLAGPVFDEETTLSAELDFSLLAGAKLDFDVAGHYARPDVFKLSVNESPQQAVISVTER
ncbi:MAG: carbon-nitrogen hydrolase family protein [Desulfovibrio sp.]|nr:carbon-nitrogen hydrolase family protein [Desulfovibrio sp.]